jgi:hypothetical protein
MNLLDFDELPVKFGYHSFDIKRAINAVSIPPPKSTITISLILSGQNKSINAT